MSIIKKTCGHDHCIKLLCREGQRKALGNQPLVKLSRDLPPSFICFLTMGEERCLPLPHSGDLVVNVLLTTDISLLSLTFWNEIKNALCNIGETRMERVCLLRWYLERPNAKRILWFCSRFTDFLFVNIAWHCRSTVRMATGNSQNVSDSSKMTSSFFMAVGRHPQCYPCASGAKPVYPFWGNSIKCNAVTILDFASSELLQNYFVKGNSKNIFDVPQMTS